ERAQIDITEAAPTMRRAAIASVSVATTLVIVKFAAGILTGSVAILSSLVDSLLDLVASLVTLFAVGQAAQPADRQHRFGHGKAEALGSLAQGAIILGSAAFLLFEAADRLIDPVTIERTGIGIGVIVFSILLTIALVIYQRRVVAKTQSMAIDADSLHYKGDLLMNLAVIAALVLSGYLGITWADPLFALAIALYLGFNAAIIARGAIDVLMDRELPHEDRVKIQSLVLSHKDVVNMHDLRTRSSGAHVFIQFHIELPRTIGLVEAHDISDEIEDDLLERYPGAEVIIHADPLGVEERRDSF
ncbi:MAG: cation diffusion facilitator family transporter, partial [Alphaproteobacteria bacterium]|nr:cation diffusion facilitator family transporter [Alphaproteobacteria bacterium]